MTPIPSHRSSLGPCPLLFPFFLSPSRFFACYPNRISPARHVMLSGKNSFLKLFTLPGVLRFNYEGLSTSLVVPPHFSPKRAFLPESLSEQLLTRLIYFFGRKVAVSGFFSVPYRRVDVGVLAFSKAFSSRFFIHFSHSPSPMPLIRPSASVFSTGYFFSTCFGFEPRLACGLFLLVRWVLPLRLPICRLAPG